MKNCGICGLCVVSLLTVTAVFAQDEIVEKESAVEYSASLMWDSKYVSEGRDNLSDGGMGSVEAAVGYEGLTAGAWYALADTVSYDELNLFTEYGFKLGDFELYGGYTRLEFMKDDEYDNELFTGVALNVIDWLVPVVDYVYSTEAQGGDGGSFIEASLVSPIELIEGVFVVEPYVLEGFDLGYASDHYDGFNNFQFGVCVYCAISEQWEIVSSINHSIANQDIRYEGGRFS